MDMRLLRSIPYAALLVTLVLGLSGAAPDPAALAGPAAPTFTVNSLGDAVAVAPLDSGPCETATGNHICTLRAAIMKANHYPGGGATVAIGAGVHGLTIPLTGGPGEAYGDLDLTASMTLAGAGAASAIVDGNAVDHVFDVATGITVTISDLTIRNGLTPDFGGGIRNSGNLTLNQVIVAGNRASSGGGIRNEYGQLELNNSLVYANRADEFGGGIASLGTLRVNNSTISNNTASLVGGGLYVSAGSTVNLYFSTIAGNLADDDSNGYGGSGGIHSESSNVNLRGMLLAENFASFDHDDCGGLLTSLGYNLVQSTTGGCTLGGTPTGNQLNVDPLLEPLRDNGGPTPTRGLLDGSPAINAVPAGQCLDRLGAPLAADQRGFPRPSEGACDIGAFEGRLPASLYNRNLIRNGDGETAVGTSATARVAAPHWTPEDGSGGTVVRYLDVEGFQSPTSPGPANKGVSYLVDGPNSEGGSISQTITLTSIASGINTGRVPFELSGYLGGKGTDPDSATFFLQAFDSIGNQLVTAAIGPVSAANRNNLTGLLFRPLGGFLPVGTDHLVMTLTFVRSNGIYDDAAADNLSLVLRPPPVMFLPLLLR